MESEAVDHGPFRKQLKNAKVSILKIVLRTKMDFPNRRRTIPVGELSYSNIAAADENIDLIGRAKLAIYYYVKTKSGDDGLKCVSYEQLAGDLYPFSGDELIPSLDALVEEGRIMEHIDDAEGEYFYTLNFLLHSPPHQHWQCAVVPHLANPDAG